MADANTRVKNRVRAVIDSLEANNPKKTSKLCKELEKEFPNSSFAKVRHLQLYFFLCPPGLYRHYFASIFNNNIAPTRSWSLAVLILFHT